MNIHDLTKVFNQKFGLKKSDVAIKSAINNHGIKCGRGPKERLVEHHTLFTQKQVDFIAQNYKLMTIKNLVELIENKFNKKVTSKQLFTFVKNHKIKSGRTGQFQPGHKSWNKGTKGICRANKGSFKKGNLPGNTKPLGSERICSKDGFVLIKIAEKNPYTGAKTRYKHKHIYVWEESNRSVPDGYVIAFKDGNKLNCDLDNLMAISRAELLRLNQYGYKDLPVELKPSVLALTKLQVKIWQKEKMVEEN